MAKGIVAAGHELTVRAAEQILDDGGNAFDAAIAACYAACMAEPVLASPGGGGFLLARPAGAQPVLYDFFVQTPGTNRRESLDFMPVLADFGEARQEFHIGLASIAVPGVMRGLFSVHRDLGHIPMRELVDPALSLARDGVRVNAFQAYILDIVAPIFLHDPACRNHFSGSRSGTRLLAEGDTYYPRKMADTLEALAIEGDRLFYEGEIAELIRAACESGGGLLSAADLKNYACIKRAPLEFCYRDWTVLSNPPPASGGILIAFALQLLQHVELPSAEYGSMEKLRALMLVMELTQQARLDHLQVGDELARLLAPDLLQRYAEQVSRKARAYRGTTHISIIDKQGNMAGLTLTNGEGCGYMLGNTGIMLNNMLGEQDLNPHGFFRWPCNQRMTSMMAPSLILGPDGTHVVTGSGGSNRIRSALMQVMINIIDHGMPMDMAVSSPRMHYEDGQLNVEGLFDTSVLEQLQARVPGCRIWPERNLYFGGAHSVMQQGDVFSGAGDSRRGGVCRVVA